jgi:hypothetical protein
LASLLLASAFELIVHGAERVGVPAPAALAGMLLCEIVAIVLLASWSRRAGWGPNHYLAVAAAAVLTYGWVGLRSFLGGVTNLGEPVGAIDLAGQMLETAALLALIAWATARARHEAHGPMGGAPGLPGAPPGSRSRCTS